VRALVVEAGRGGYWPQGIVVVLTGPVPSLDGWSLVASRLEGWDFRVYEHPQEADERFARLLAGMVPTCPPRVLAVCSDGLVPVGGHGGTPSLGGVADFLAEALRQYLCGDGEVAAAPF
jgi:hypothetical protein